MNRPLRVFLCHSSNDKPAVRELYQKLRAEPWIQPWLDEEELYPGQDWNLEIEKAVEAADAIIVCLTKNSINKEGYVQRELRIVLDFADYKPEGTLYIMPVRLEECEPPRRLRAWQYADYFEGQRERGLQRLLVSLKRRADSLGLKYEQPTPPQKKKPIEEIPTQKKVDKPEGNRFEKSYARAQKLIAEANERVQKNIEGRKPVEAIQGAQPEHSTVNWRASNKITLSNGMEFMRVPAGKFLMGSNDHSDEEKPEHTVDIPYAYWMGRFPVTNALYNQFRKISFDKGKESHPVIQNSWHGAQNYVKWLNEVNFASQLPKGYIFRLPSEAEWEKAARGEKGLIYPWGNQFDKKRCNSKEGGKGSTSPVSMYSPQGDSPYGCADMAGNVWEWTRSIYKPYPYIVDDGREDENPKNLDSLSLRGGSWLSGPDSVRASCRNTPPPNNLWNNIGFRVVVSLFIDSSNGWDTF
jgi:formylglycine-generating enzyme required for sulfatase activity